MVGFTSVSSKEGPSEFIPSGTLAYAVVSKFELRQSQATSGTYAMLELTIASGPFMKRKIFNNGPMDPDDENNSEAMRQRGMSALARMLEAVGIFVSTDPASYTSITRFDQGIEAIYNMSLQGKYIAVRVGLEKGKGGYQDRNTVSAFLSPNPANSDYKDWQKLQNGGGAVSGGAAPVAAAAFGTRPAALAAPAWAGGAATQSVTQPVRQPDPDDDEIPF